MPSTIRGYLLALLLFTSANGLASVEEAQRHLDAGKYDQAMSSVEKILQKKKNNPEARFMKGLILVQQGKNTQAITVFTRLTRDFPDLPEPYNNLAVIYATQGEYDKAREALKSALQTHPSYTTAYVNLGDIYAKLASEAYQQALALDKADSRKVSIKLSLIDKLFPPQPTAAEPVISEPAIAKATPVKETPAAKQPPVAKKPTPVETAAVVATATNSISNTDPNLPKKNTRAVVDMLKNWAAAWSAQDVEKYLSFYDNRFKPYKSSASVWRSQREQRLKRPTYIKVNLQNIDIIELTDSKAKVTVKQTYESNSYRDSAKKLFRLVKNVGSGWKIYRESVVSQ